MLARANNGRETLRGRHGVSMIEDDFGLVNFFPSLDFEIFFESSDFEFFFRVRTLKFFEVRTLVFFDLPGSVYANDRAVAFASGHEKILSPKPVFSPFYLRHFF